MALQWRDEGARIVGGCCGVTPEHMAAARTGLEGTRPGKSRSVVSEWSTAVINGAGIGERDPVIVRPWVDGEGKHLFPLSFPEIVTDPRVFPPTQGSFSGLEAPLSKQESVKRSAAWMWVAAPVFCPSSSLSTKLHGSTRLMFSAKPWPNTLANAVCNEVSDQVRGLLDQYWNLGQDSQVGTRRNADGHVGCAIGDEKNIVVPQFLTPKKSLTLIPA